MQSIPDDPGRVNYPGGMKRTPLKRTTPTPRARKPIPTRSAKTQKLYDERVPIIRAAVEAGQPCEASVLIASVDLKAANRCQITAVDWHEVKTRGRGGSIVDPANRLWTCRRCHDWIGANPIAARRAGVVLNSWDPDPTAPPAGPND